MVSERIAHETAARRWLLRLSLPLLLSACSIEERYPPLPRDGGGDVSQQPADHDDASDDSDTGAGERGVGSDHGTLDGGLDEGFDSSEGTAGDGSLDTLADSSPDRADSGPTVECTTASQRPCIPCGIQSCVGGAWGVCMGQPTFAVGELRWPMPNPPGIGLPNPAKYDTTTTPGAVIDQLTSLTWQRDVSSSTATQAQAQMYCASLTLAGGGWRLPTVIELVSIVDDTKDPALDSTAFPNTPMNFFWSSSPSVAAGGGAWTVFAVTGSTNAYDVTELGAVRCVR